MASRSGIFVGLNKGFIVTKPKVNTRKNKISYRKGRLGQRVKLVREVIREVVGLAPYEKKMMEMIRTGVASKEKKALRMGRARLGTHQRALRKREELTKMIAHSRKAK